MHFSNDYSRNYSVVIVVTVTRCDKLIINGPVKDNMKFQISVEERRPAKPASFQTNNSNGVHLSQTSIQGNISSLHHSSALHSRKSKSNANLSSLDCTDNVNNGGLQPNKPVINHGKPNLAPKPPVLNGKCAYFIAYNLKK